jgi:hypothetical protein
VYVWSRLSFGIPSSFSLQYVDRTRGPLNEGGLFGERQGLSLRCAVVMLGAYPT